MIIYSIIWVVLVDIKNCKPCQEFIVKSLLEECKIMRYINNIKSQVNHLRIIDSVQFMTRQT